MNTAREELEEMDYWTLRRKFPMVWKKGISREKLIKDILLLGRQSFIGGECKRVDTGDSACRVDDLIEFMKQKYELLSKGGVLTIEVPLAPHNSAFLDPSYKRFFSFGSFSFFDERDDHWKNIGKERGYPAFRFVKENQIGNTLTVELTK